MPKTGHFSFFVALTVIIASVWIISACKTPYATAPATTNTPFPATSSFATPIGQTPGIAMSDVASFGTSTAFALSGTPQAIDTQTLAVSTQDLSVTAAPTPLPPGPGDYQLTLSVSASPQTYGYAGGVIIFTYTVTNTGGVSLGPAQFTIAEKKLAGPLNCGSSDITLAPNESIACSASYVIKPEDLGSATLTIASTVSGGGQTSAPAVVTIINLLASGTQTQVPYNPPATTIQHQVTEGERLIDIAQCYGADIAEIQAANPEITDPNMNLSPPTVITVPRIGHAGRVFGPPCPPLPEQAATAVESYPKASYNIVAPVTLNVDESYTVQLYMSRALSGPELSTQIVVTQALVTSTADPDIVINPEGQASRFESGVVEVTPAMLVELKAENSGAFEVLALHPNAIQDVLPTKTAVWLWKITAKQQGNQNLIFVISQQTRLEDETHWVPLGTVTKVVQVHVTVAQRIGGVDWEWIVGTIITLIAIPALWRWIDGLQKKSKLPGQSRYKREAGLRPSTQKNALGGLPRRSNAEREGNESMGNVFISYRRSDSADIAGRIYDRLVEEFGPDSIFKDVDSIPLGVDFKKYLDQKVGECKVLLAIIGDRWVDATDSEGKRRLDDRADFVRVEIESALKRDIPVIPLLVRGAPMPVEEHLPYSLRRLVFKNGIQIRPDPDFHRDMDRLIAALERYIQGEE